MTDWNRIYPREFDDLYARALGNDRRDKAPMHVCSNLLLRVMRHHEIMSAMCAINALALLSHRIENFEIEPSICGVPKKKKAS